MTKISLSLNSTKRATHFGQGLSINFIFAGVLFKNTKGENNVLVSLVKIGESLSLNISQGCNLTPLVVVKYLTLNGYASSY